MQIFNSNYSDFVELDGRNTMYPSYGFSYYGEEKTTDVPKYSTLYGYSFSGQIKVGNKKYTLDSGQFFSIPIFEDIITISRKLFCIFRLGYLGQRVLGWVDDNKGRLSYIDGCSDSMLVYPPRLGDPSLNYLHFPENTEQSFHTHPSIRIGCVIGGNGVAHTKTNTYDLVEGSSFLLNEKELHRFTTSNNHMEIIGFHPDGDWGPQDENHPMLNKTYISK